MGTVTAGSDRPHTWDRGMQASAISDDRHNQAHKKKLGRRSSDLRTGSSFKQSSPTHDFAGSLASLLTEEQRATLDAAVAAKQHVNLGDLRLSSGGASSDPPRNPIRAVPSTRAKQEAELDRSWSRPDKGPGRAKKNGCGGKYTWVGRQALLDEADDPGSRELDAEDPNYDSDEQDLLLPRGHAEELQAYKQAVTALIEEYFNSGDHVEAAASLRDARQPQLHHWFVKRAVALAMDKHDKEREMTSVLLCSLHNTVVFTDDMETGFSNLVAILEDLQLDVPEAVDLLARFILRAVTDEVLPPAFVKTIPGGLSSSMGRLRTRCEVGLAGKHSAERWRRCWGGTAGRSLDQTRTSIHDLLKEYQLSYDMAEAERCLRALAVPFFHHELVKQMLLSAIEAPQHSQALLGLLEKLSASGEVSESQTAQGFHRVRSRIGDLELDCPRAQQQLDELARAATAAGLLDRTWASQEPSPPASQPALAPQAFKLSSSLIIQEYLQTGDTAEAARSLEELQQPAHHSCFVKQAVRVAMERLDKEREMVAVLLNVLCPEPLKPQDLTLGFSLVLQTIKDTALDCPDAATCMALMMARMCVDRVLPSTCLEQLLPSLTDGSLGVSVVHSAGKILSAHNASQRVRQAWQGGPRSAAQLEACMQKLVADFTAGSADGEQVFSRLAALPARGYYHEFVYQVLQSACSQPNDVQKLQTLLDQLSSSGLVSQTQMSRGFTRWEQDMQSQKADGPAQTAFESCVERANASGWLVSA